LERQAQVRERDDAPESARDRGHGASRRAAGARAGE
jgi:hypothetical protein